ncbi:BON domain-containing protein [candidate division WWE3 bacterium]|nr:BON domain-containing protein [candidate division WWE3 bacterium]
MKKTNDQILNDIKDQLVWDTQVISSDVNVLVTGDGAVTLSGTVPSFSAKRAAETDAWSVWGVTSVENNLTVKYPTVVTIPSDEEVKSNIENVLLWNSAIDSTDVEVFVEAGIVTLEGTVDSFWKKLRAEELASDVVGVLSVENLLAVVPTESYIDKDIATDITDSMDRKAAVNAENVTVEVENGEVTLSGTVPTFTAWSEAYDSARYTAGVVDVEDQLTITYS